MRKARDRHRCYFRGRIFEELIGLYPAVKFVVQFPSLGMHVSQNRAEQIAEPHPWIPSTLQTLKALKYNSHLTQRTAFLARTDQYSADLRNRFDITNG